MVAGRAWARHPTSAALVRQKSTWRRRASSVTGTAVPRCALSWPSVIVSEGRRRRRSAHRVGSAGPSHTRLEDRRYDRTREAIRILERAWTEREPPGDAHEFGREVIPLVRAEVARRDATAA